MTTEEMRAVQHAMELLDRHRHTRRDAPMPPPPEPIADLMNDPTQPDEPEEPDIPRR